MKAMRLARNLGLLACFIFLLFLVWGNEVMIAQTNVLTPPQTPIPATFFGMHASHFIDPNRTAAPGIAPITPWPQVPMPSWRLWDVRVTWSDLEPAKGQWKFDVLDQTLKLARVHHTDVQLTFGFTPQWTASRPTEASLYHPGGASEPMKISDWDDYVRTVATHCKGQVHIYEIWNEPNLPRYWSGTVGQMVEMTHHAHDIIKSIDPTALIVSPSPFSPNGIPWLSEFLKAGGGRYVDIIGYHCYVFPSPPEAMIRLIMQIKTVMRANGIEQKPLWDTEAGWARPAPFPSEELGAAYLARAYIVNWADGIGRFYWYSWDAHGWVSLFTTTNDSFGLTPAGKAYGVIQQWLVGATMQQCSSDADQTWTCQLSRSKKPFRIVWNVKGASTFTPPPSWHVKTITPLLEKPRSFSGPSVNIGTTPILFNSGG